jgi:hypothetical protein
MDYGGALRHGSHLLLVSRLTAQTRSIRYLQPNKETLLRHARPHRPQLFARASLIALERLE